MVVAALVIGAAGCSSATSGEASAGDGPPLPETSPPDPTPSEPTDTGGASADLQPCELLSVRDLTALDLPASGEEQKIGPARRCQWQTPGSRTVSVGILDALGIDEVQSDSPPEPLTVGSHEAVRYAGVGTTCGVAIALTESSRVDVLGTAYSGDESESCGLAERVAELLEPRLPRPEGG